jgi:hypothetical protein
MKLLQDQIAYRVNHAQLQKMQSLRMSYVTLFQEAKINLGNWFKTN